jgi:hypothetical protein
VIHNSAPSVVQRRQCGIRINDLLRLKNASTQISLFLTSYEQLAPMAIEKIKILGVVLELPAKQQCQSSPFTSKIGQMG